MCLSEETFKPLGWSRRQVNQDSHTGNSCHDRWIRVGRQANEYLLKPKKSIRISVIMGISCHCSYAPIHIEMVYIPISYYTNLLDWFDTLLRPTQWNPLWQSKIQITNTLLPAMRGMDTYCWAAKSVCREEEQRCLRLSKSLWLR